VLIVDDLLATGGTARATVDLVKGLGGEVHALAFLIELVGLNGRQRLTGERVHAVLQY
jgi:adenine phosphoribosyltransferase